MNGNIHILLTLLPEETLYSLASRICAINGYRNHHTFCDNYFGANKNPRVADAVLDIKHFNFVTGAAYGDFDKLCKANTILPIFNKFGLIQGQSFQKSNDKKYKVLSNFRLELATVSNSSPHIWKWCPECLCEEYENFGTTYWHRNHQLPGVYVCTKHLCSLLEVSIPFRMRQKTFFNPDTIPDLFIRKLSCPTKDGLELAIRLASFIEECNLDASVPFSNAIVNQVLLDGLQIHGLVNKNKILKKDAFISAFNSHLKPLVDIEEISQLVSANKQSLQLNRALSSLNPSSITLKLVIAHWMFGSSKLFNEYCLWQQMMTTESATNHLNIEDHLKLNSVDDKNTHPKICIDFLKANPSGTRTEFWKAAPKSCRWLKLHDTNWFNTTITPTSDLGYQIELFKT